MNEPYRTYAIDATTRWSSFIKMDASAWSKIFNSTFKNGIVVFGYEEKFLNSSTIAACGVNEAINLDGVKMNSKSFSLIINTKYANVYNATQWTEILSHELGHALGIGPFWSDIGNFNQVIPINDLLDGNAYSNSQEAYNTITGLNIQKIPLEISGEKGTAGVHWENNYRLSDGVGYTALSNELMTGYYDKEVRQVLSRLSLKALVDFGYVEINPETSEGTPTLSTGFSMLSDGAVKLNCCLNNSIIPEIERINTINTSLNINSLGEKQDLEVLNFIVEDE
jgi:hypothetical protein